MAIDIFSPRQISAALMLSGTPQQTDAMQDMFYLGKFTVDESFQLCQRKSRLGGGESRQKFGKIRSASLILGKASRPLMVFNHRYQMVGDFGGAEDGGHLPCPALLSRISATRRKRSAFATDVPPNFNTRMVVTSLPLVEKKPALSGAGFSVFPVRVSPHRYLW